MLQVNIENVKRVNGNHSLNYANKFSELLLLPLILSAEKIRDRPKNNGSLENPYEAYGSFHKSSKKVKSFANRSFSHPSHRIILTQQVPR